MLLKGAEKRRSGVLICFVAFSGRAWVRVMAEIGNATLRDKLQETGEVEGATSYSRWKCWLIAGAVRGAGVAVWSGCVA